MSDWTIAALPLLGAAFGAALQFWFSRAAERERHVETLRAQSYSDYLRAVAAAGHLRSDEDLRDAHRDAADAKARIAVYGTAAVVKALARFEETGAILHGEAAHAAFVALVSAMRPSGAAVAQRDLGLLLLGPDAHRPSRRRE
ncbi:MAG TPA: hypothetical protein VJP77_09720 [Planctomycetota bacterium]|nr:hypothetical protein [Planctomycetota bacterium]